MSEFGLARWERLWSGLTPLLASRDVFALLANRHAEPGRYYHNARHVSECLSEFDRVAPLATQTRAVELAIWFHDAVYDPRAADNEERSAELARDCLWRLGAETELIETVAGLVLATKTHDGSVHPDAPLLVDVDLGILGQAPPRFQEYERQIRAEYAWVPAPTFAAKRTEILERFLARPRIYHTRVVYERYEMNARQNLRDSIRRLRDY